MLEPGRTAIEDKKRHYRIEQRKAKKKTYVCNLWKKYPAGMPIYIRIIPAGEVQEEKIY